MTSHILLTGGTGTLGRLVAPRLRAADCQVRCEAEDENSDHSLLLRDISEVTANKNRGREWVGSRLL